MNNEYKEYDTVMITISDGTEQEFAIMNEFELEGQKYVVVSLIKEDEIQEGLYLYRAVEKDGEFKVERIEDAEEMTRATDYYYG